MPPASNIVDLRRLLAERFGAAVRPRPVSTVPALPTGLEGLDPLLGGGWPRGEVSELVGEGHGSGTAQVLQAWIRQTAREGQFLALADGTDSLDLDSLDPAILTRLLWVRCRGADEALKAADILLRDRNFSRVVVDLKLCPATELRRLSSSVWHRFHRLTEQHGTTALVITPQPLVSGAACRVQVRGSLGLEALAQGPVEAERGLRFELLRGAVVRGSDVQEAAG